MPKIKTKNLQPKAESIGNLSRIEEIKSTISSLKPQVCKAEVYETWDNIFEPQDK